MSEFLNSNLQPNSETSEERSHENIQEDLRNNSHQSGIVSNYKNTKDKGSIYNYIPTLLELPDIKCHNFTEKFKTLIEGLLTDIGNINNDDPSISMLYEKNTHIKNANEVLRAMIDCIYCIVNNIRRINDNNDNVDIYDCNQTHSENIPETNVNSDNSMNILKDTFKIITTEPDTTIKRSV
jgi:hypothetical protein